MNTGLRGMAIRGIAAYAPPDAISNDEIAERLLVARATRVALLRRSLDPDEAKLYETSDRWIRRFIGFQSRRFVRPGEGTIDLAVRATRLLQGSMNLDLSTIDLIVFATVTPSYLNSPPDAALLQHALGIPEYGPDGAPHRLAGFTASLACSSWVASFAQCYAAIRSGMAERILLIGADAMSTTINWNDRAFATVLGDGGTATLLETVPGEEDWFSPDCFWNWLGGSHATTIITPKGGSRAPLRTADEIANFENCLIMDGKAVREEIVPFVAGAGIDAALAQAGRTLPGLNLAVLHEANRVLNRSVTDAWRTRGFRGTVLDAGGNFGNTTSASIPLALALNVPELRTGRQFGLFGFGGGYSASFAFGTIKHEISVVIEV